MALFVDIVANIPLRLIRLDLTEVARCTNRLLVERRGGKFYLVLLHYCDWRHLNMLQFNGLNG